MASSVPKCSATSSMMGGSVTFSRCWAATRWAELLTGRNSVRPWIRLRGSPGPFPWSLHRGPARRATGCGATLPDRLWRARPPGSMASGGLRLVLRRARRGGLRHAQLAHHGLKSGQVGLDGVAARAQVHQRVQVVQQQLLIQEVLADALAEAQDALLDLRDLVRRLSCRRRRQSICPCTLAACWPREAGVGQARRRAAGRPAASGWPPRAWPAGRRRQWARRGACALCASRASASANLSCDGLRRDLVEGFRRWRTWCWSSLVRSSSVWLWPVPRVRHWASLSVYALVAADRPL